MALFECWTHVFLKATLGSSGFRWQCLLSVFEIRLQASSWTESGTHESSPPPLLLLLLQWDTWSPLPCPRFIPHSSGSFLPRYLISQACYRAYWSTSIQGYVSVFKGLCLPRMSPEYSAPLGLSRENTLMFKLHLHTFLCVYVCMSALRMW